MLVPTAQRSEVEFPVPYSRSSLWLWWPYLEWEPVLPQVFSLWLTLVPCLGLLCDSTFFSLEKQRSFHQKNSLNSVLLAWARLVVVVFFFATSGWRARDYTPQENPLWPRKSSILASTLLVWSRVWKKRENPLVGSCPRWSESLVGKIMHKCGF